MVPWQGGRMLYETYSKDGRPAEWHTFPMEHQVCLEEIEVIRDWLKPRFEEKNNFPLPAQRGEG